MPAACRRLRATRQLTRGQEYADQAALHDGGQVALREDPVPSRHLGDQEPRRLGRVPPRRLRGPRALEPGRRRHPGAEVFPQGRRARAPEAGRGDAGAVLAVALRADERRLAELPPNERTGGETDARQVFDRLAGSWTYWGWKGGYFSSEDDARAFYDEHRYMLAMQMARPQQPAVVQHRPALGLRHRRPAARATTTSTPRPAS